MKKIKLKLKENTYEIIIATDLLRKAGLFISKLGMGTHAYVITNDIINKNYGKILKASLGKKKIVSTFRLVKDSEKAKSIYICIRLIRDILKFEKTLDTFIIALGGGVVGDLAGFVASIYKRGIPYIQIPTTLLGQIDSGIGGKTAVDLKEAKNMIGTFYQPALVLNDISLLKTLNIRQMRSGIAEAIKYGIIKDGFILDYIERYFKDIMIFEEGILEKLVYRCAKIKVRIVELDEKEKNNIRTILNFGHTVGHALEAASGYRLYTHGEAVGIGMLVALYIGLKLRITAYELFNRVEYLMRKIELPLKIDQRISVDKIIQAYYYDKKFKAQKNRFVLLENIGKTIIKEDIPLFLVREAIERFY